MKINLGDNVQVDFFCMATRQSPGLPETLATACNPGMCPLEPSVIMRFVQKR